MTLSDAIEGFLLYKAATTSKNTVRDYRNTLRQWSEFLEGDPDVEALELQHIQRFLYHLRVDRKLAPKTIKNAHTGLSAFFTWLERDHGIPHLIRGHIPSPKANPPEIIPLTKRDVRDLLWACNRSAPSRRVPAGQHRPTRFRDRAIVLFLVDTGVRASELCDLKIGDVDMDTGAVQVRNGKGDKARTTYIGTVAREALWRNLSERKFKAADDPLFATSRRQPMDRDALRKMLLAAGRRAELTEPVGPHRLRHTFAITYLRNGGDIFTLQRLLGHSSLDMVRRYLAIAQVDVADAHRRASPADNWRLA